MTSENVFGAGAVFDWAANFGNAYSPTASFIVASTDRPLLIEDLLNQSHPLIGGLTYDVNFAARVREVEVLETKPGVTVGGAVVPEPTTALLLACGLGGLAFEGRRRANASGLL